MGKKYARKNEVGEERRAEIRKLLLKAAADSSLRLTGEQEILNAVGAQSREYGAVFEELDRLIDGGKIVRSRKGRYLFPEAYDLMAGTMRRSAGGFGFVLLDDRKEEIFIPKSQMNHAIDKDRVLIRLMSERRGERRTGSVEKIVSHTLTFVTGTFTVRGKQYFLLPDDRRIGRIRIDGEKTMEARPGDKVRVDITEYPDHSSVMKGEVTEIYGRAGESRAEEAAVVDRYDIRTGFSEEVLEEAGKISEKLNKTDLKGREDLRGKTIVTIDGADARDFDDAVRVEKTQDGDYILYVCIADVSHYVREGSALDREALLRGCSVYFPDRVFPMLPEELSNGVCSLNEGEDRLTLTAEMTISAGGDVTGYRIYESVIRSSARLIYGDISDLLEGGDEELQEKYEELLPMLCDMRDLAEILFKKRSGEGSIDFEVPEPHICTDEDGAVLFVEPGERRVANRMIEEFMLEANRVVAEHCFWMDLPFVYRVHERPDQMKMEELKRFAGSLGLTFRGSCINVRPKTIQDLLLQAKERDCGTVIGRIALRSMKKAVYDTECKGHFGLGFRYYCHFTSPIRRYPDLIVHRILKDTIRGTADMKRYRRLTKLTREAAEISSDRERVSTDAERAVEKIMTAVYMSRFEGAVFDGMISGVIGSGFFVELENTAEGYVPAEVLADDYYICDEKNYRMIGERRKRIFAIGDRIRVRVDRVNTMTGDIDLSPAEEEGTGYKDKERRGGKRKRRRRIR